MTRRRRRGVWLVVLGAIAALVLGVATTLSAAAGGIFRSPGPTGGSAPSAQCGPPSLRGRVVDVTVGDMGGMMRRMMGDAHDHLPPGGGPSWNHSMGMMWLRATPRAVPAGTVSLRVVNTGAFAHEVVVLPLRTGQAVGERPVGTNGKTSEAGSPGEASRTCGTGKGEGIAPGATGWTTLTLRSGRYELVCDIPGHYAAGMYDELDVTSR
ncbi:sulfocyanin-like copper-binding protein [Streptomyces sparsogenes]|uniref:sulfocyanin-like copper-binding protein n=1 Tax=Streptomyces sparsogenes TaxID=67365 RepID=UPI0033E7C3CB